MTGTPPTYITVRAPSLATVDPMADPRKLAATGKRVGERLRATEGIAALGGGRAELFVQRGFLDPAECARLVGVVDGRIGPSELFKGTEVDGFRTSSTHYFDNGDPEIDALQKRICDTLGLAQVHAEVMQGQRYEPGQQYKHHFDYFTLSQDYWQQERRRGGQRTWTSMVCLDQPEGGETDFARLHERIAPQPGTLIAWNNMDPAGQPNPFTLHAGLPVLGGVKHVITQWFRQEEWSLHLR